MKSAAVSLDPGPARPLWVRLVRNLTVQVLFAIALGIALGHWAPARGESMKWLADAFIQLVKWFIGPIVFITVTLGIGGAGNLWRAGWIGIKALVYFEIVTTLALLIGVGVSMVVKPGVGVAAAAGRVQAVAEYTAAAQTFTWKGFFLQNITLQVLVGALLAGGILLFVPQRERVLRRLEEAGHWVFVALMWAMRLAPIGAFGGMAYTVGKFGLASLLPLGRLMLCVYLTMALFIGCVLGPILRWAGFRLWTFLGAIREEILLVLGTSSSEAALPQLMHKLVKLGCPRPVVGLVVPAGYSFNLDGTTIYLSMAVLFLGQVYGVHLTWEQIGSLVLILMLTSKGAAGVTGSGFITLATTLSAVKVIPVEGLALLIGVDRFMSEARAITNLIGNGVAALVIGKGESGESRKNSIHTTESV